MKRVCKKCGEEKYIESFVKSKWCKYGYCFTCKKCQSKINLLYYKENREHIIEYQSKWSLKRYPNRKHRIKKEPVIIRHGIYKIQSKLFPDKIYIGSSKNIDQRFVWHIESLTNKRSHF